MDSCLGLGHKNTVKNITELKLSEQRIVGMFAGYFFASILVEHQNGERQIVAWGHDSSYLNSFNLKNNFFFFIFFYCLFF